MHFLKGNRSHLFNGTDMRPFFKIICPHHTHLQKVYYSQLTNLPLTKSLLASITENGMFLKNAIDIFFKDYV